MSIKRALDEAISVIMSYECDIRDCKNQFGIDLVEIGFCQGSVYKNALRMIKEERKKSEVTEEWFDEKAEQIHLYVLAGQFHNEEIRKDFIRSLVEEIK